MSSSSRFGPWELEADDGTVVPVVVPGTVTQAHPQALDADERTWVFRTVVTSVPPDPVLVLEGVATAYQVFVDGQPLFSGASMYASVRVPVVVREGSVVEIRCLPLAAALPEEKAPRARWRTRLVDNNDLRLIRTTLLGRCPGIAPGPPVVGPWRPVRLESRASEVRLSTRLEGTVGVLSVEGPGEFTCRGVTGTGELRIPDVELWWPHTHGRPVLHEVTRMLDGVSSVVGRVGFRSVVNASSSSVDLVVNGVPVWARGAVWTPPGLLTGVPADPFETVQLAVDAGMNMLRVPGVAPYESTAFFEACDELGVMVWHDLALANLDVPHDLLEDALVGELQGLLSHPGPSLVVVCGGSETAQQVAMLGLDPSLWASPFLLEKAPARVADRAIWVANSPAGGDLPFRVGSGVAHYFGVGGYRRPLSDVRASGVLFASECLAFANPSSEGEDWVPRDSGSDWDFADVRSHYASLLDRPSEAVVGELMAAVFGEWRRTASPNRGGLVLWLRDLQPGAGWGVLASDGIPKPPWWYLRRSLAPQAIWLTDEGLDGVAVHLANDLPTPWAGSLRLALYRSDDLRLEQVSVPVVVNPHASWTADVEAVIGHFVDVSYAFRFGPVSVSAVVATFEDGSASPVQAFHFPAGHPDTTPHPPDVITLELSGDLLRMTSERLLDTVQLRCDPRPADNFFCLEPGVTRTVTGVRGDLTVTALNLQTPEASLADRARPGSRPPA